MALGASARIANSRSGCHEVVNSVAAAAVVEREPLAGGSSSTAIQLATPAMASAIAAATPTCAPTTENRRLRGMTTARASGSSGAARSSVVNSATAASNSRQSAQRPRCASSIRSSSCDSSASSRRETCARTPSQLRGTGDTAIFPRDDTAHEELDRGARLAVPFDRHVERRRDFREVTRHRMVPSGSRNERGHLLGADLLRLPAARAEDTS